MKAVKIVGVILLVALLVVGGLFFYGLRNLDSIIETAVERFGSDATQTEVAVGGVQVDLQKGRLQLADLTVANPPGYNTDYALALGGVAVQVDPSSISSREDAVVVIDEISVDGAHIVAELQGLEKSNLQELAKNVQSRLPAEQGRKPEPETEAEYSGPNFRVRAFRFADADIDLVSDQFGDRTIKMPAVTASDLGGTAGLPPAELSAALLQQVLDQAVAAVRKEVEGAAKREVRSKLKEKAREKLDEEDQQKLKDLRGLLNR